MPEQDATDPLAKPSPNAQPEGAEGSGGGPIPGMATTYGRDAAAIEREREAQLADRAPDPPEKPDPRPEHIKRAGHRADVAEDPEPVPDPDPVHDLPIAYLAPDGYGVAQDLRGVYERYKGGNPRAAMERMLERIEEGMKAFETQPFAEDPLGDAPVE